MHPTFKKRVFLYLFFITIGLLLVSCAENNVESSGGGDNDSSNKQHIFLADPMVFHYDGTYYLYGTRFAGRGILVYKSTDLKHWEGPVGASGGFALRKSDVYSGKAVMGADVLRYNNQFYFFYTSNQHIAVATSSFPAGPFTQSAKKPLNLKGKTIAPHVFIDDNGEKYLYYTKLDHGNKIYVARLNDDLLSVKEGTAKECLHATEPWENTDKNPNPNWPITEAPAVLKHKGTYYLFYSANHYKNPDYNVGYATSSSPLGPWEKFKGNPLLDKTPKVVGMGSCTFVRNTSGEIVMFYHTHYSRKKVAPRKTAYSICEFVSGPKGQPDIFKVENKINFIYKTR